MFGGRLGFPEIALILVVLLLIFGPKKLPELGRSVGESLRSFKKAVNQEDKDKDKDKDPS